MFCFGHIEHLDGLTHKFSFLHHCALDLDGIFSPDGLWHQSKTFNNHNRNNNNNNNNNLWNNNNNNKNLWNI